MRRTVLLPDCGMKIIAIRRLRRRCRRREVLQRQIDYNWAIAEEGMTGNWGAAIGKTLMEAYGNSVHNRAKAMAAAGIGCKNERM